MQKNRTKALKSFPTFWVIGIRNAFYASFVCLLFLIIMFVGAPFRHMTVTVGIIVFLIPIAFMYSAWYGILKEHTKVKIYANRITTKRMFGRKQEFHIHELKNYSTDCMVGFRVSRHEYLYIIKDDMEITIISAFYHWNYTKMKNEIDKNLSAAQGITGQSKSKLSATK